MSSSQQSEPPHTSSHTGDSRSDSAEPTPVARKQVIKLPNLAFLGVGFLLFTTLFTALSWPLAFGWLLLLPVLAAVWVVRIRTVVSPEGIVARRLLGSDSISWDEVKGIHFPDRRWARAVLNDDTEKSLPLVRFDLLPHIAAASGGRFTDPYAVAEAAEAELIEAEKAGAGPIEADRPESDNTAAPDDATEQVHPDGDGHEGDSEARR